MATNNLNFGFNNKKRFTIDGDENRVIELDTSDVGVVSRLEKSVDKITALQEKQDELTKLSEDENTALDFTKLFSEIETDMRGIIDEIFDTPVCDAILGNSSVFSPVNGRYKFEQLIETLLDQYGKDISAEAKKINKSKVAAKTAQYKK